MSMAEALTDAEGMSDAEPEEPNIISILSDGEDDDDDGDLGQSTDEQLMNVDWMVKYALLKEKHKVLRQKYSDALQKAQWWHAQCIEYAKEHNKMGEWLAQGPTTSVEVEELRKSCKGKLNCDGPDGLSEKLPASKKQKVLSVGTPIGAAIKPQEPEHPPPGHLLSANLVQTCPADPRQTRSADPLHEFHSSRPRVQQTQPRFQQAQVPFLGGNLHHLQCSHQQTNSSEDQRRKLSFW